jgi:type I restriction enzyme M protein
LDNPQATQILQKSIKGVEKKPLPHLLCITNMILQGFDQPAVNRGNMLTKSYADWTAKDQVDIVVTNPPFGGTEEDGTEKNFPKNFQTKETADLFLALIIRILKKNGRAGVVLPDGTLFGDGVKTRIKEELLSKCNLHSIVRLPNGVFNPYTSIKTNILFFEKGKPTKETWYYDMPYPEGISNFNRSKPIEIKHFDKIKKWWFDRKVNQFAWKVSLSEIKKRDFNLDFKNPHIDEKEKIYSSSELLDLIDNSFQKSAKLLTEFKKAIS